MHYINPYDLLEITAENLSDVDGATINKAKKKLLAELELSDTNTIFHTGAELNKGDCLRAIDDLDNRDKKEFHFFIYQHKHLKEFLTNGKLNFFGNYQAESIYKLPEFLDFISQFFAEQYDKMLLENYKQLNRVGVVKILSVKPITNEAFYERCYKSTYAFVKGIDTEINTITKDISNNKSPYIANKFNGLDEIINEKVNIAMLNLLPIYFQSLRNQLALSIRNLARDLNNEPHFIYKPAFKIIEIANNISTDALTKQTITKGYYTIKKNYEDGLPKQTTPKPQPITTVSEPEIEEEVEEDKIQEKETDNKSNTYYRLLVVSMCGLLGWALFSSTVLKVILVLGTLMFLIPVWNYLKKPEEFTKNKPLEIFIFLLTGGVCIGGFFYPPLGIFYASYYLLSWGHSFYYDIFQNKKYRSDRSFGYFIVAVLLTLTMMSYEKSQSERTTVVSPSESIATPTDNSTNSSNNSSPSTDNSNSISSSNNNNTYTPPDPPKPVYNFPDIANGNITGCSNIHSRYNKNLSNKLIISCGSNADVAVKMIDYATEKSIRYVYIHKNSTYTIWNIPEGKYYLKIAYGDDWGVKEGESNCEGRFTKNTLYKKGDETLDYNLVYDNDGGYQIPSFSLRLNVIFTTNDNSDKFSTDNITPNDFYNE